MGGPGRNLGPFSSSPILRVSKALQYLQYYRKDRIDHPDREGRELVNTGTPNRPHLPWCGLLILSLVSAAGGQTRAAGSAGEANDEWQRIGIYDSRAVAYAFFWTDDQQAKRNEQIRAADAAKAAGDTAQFEKLSRALSDAQEKIHRQVFSSAPVDDALSAIEPRLPEILKQAGVAALVSKWDAPALRKYPSAVQVDVTDLLVAEFKPTEKQLKVIEEIKRQKPVPLDQIDKMKD